MMEDKIRSSRCLPIAATPAIGSMLSSIRKLTLLVGGFVVLAPPLIVVLAPPLIAQSPNSRSLDPQSPNRSSPFPRRADSERQLNAETDTEDYRAILRRLSTADFATRKTLTRQLWLDRKHSRPVLRAATEDPDPEIAARANWILEQWRSGILPGASPRVAALLASGQSSDLVRTLLDLGEFEALAQSLSETDDSADARLARVRASANVRNFFPIYVVRAHKDGTLPALLSVLDHIADQRELCLTRVEMMRRLNREVTNENILPPIAKDWPASQRRSWKAMLWTALDRIELATDAAEGDVGTLHQIALATGDAATLTHAAKEIVDELKEGDNHSAIIRYRAIQVAIGLIATDWLADKSQRLATVESLLDDPIFDSKWIPEVSDHLDCSLTQIGRIPQAAERMAQIDPLGASSLLNYSMRYWEAAEVLKAEESDGNQGSQTPSRKTDSTVELNRILKQIDAYVMQKTAPPDTEANGVQVEPFGEDAMGQWMHWMTSQFLVGNDHGGRTLANRIWGALSRVSVNDHTLEPYERIRGALTDALGQSSRDDLLLELLLRGDQEIGSGDLQLIAKQLDDCDESAFTAVLGGMTEVFRGEPLSIRARATMDLFEGRIPDRFDPDKDYAVIMQSLRTPSRRQRAAGLQLRGESNLHIIAMLRRQGQNDLAETYLRQMRAQGGHRAMLILADRALRSGSADTAFELFDAVARARTDEVTKVSPSVAQWMEAEIGTAVSLDQMGLSDQADSAWQGVDWMTLCPMTYFRTSLSEKLESTDHLQAIADSLRRAAVLACFDEEQSDLYFIADALDKMHQAKSLPDATRAELADAAAWWYPIGMVGNPSFRSDWWPAFAHRSASARLEAAMLRADKKMASRMIDRLLEIRPLDILLAETTVESLRERSWNDLANETLGRVLAAGDQHMKTYPLDAAVANNLAWVAAASNESLDRALRWSRLAVDREPHSVIYRDTLAEVLYRLNRVDEAVVVESDCLLDDPGQWHLHKQIKRFESGDP